jgi:hypothetical protein
MVTNKKMIDNSDSELLDPRIYKQLIGSLIYLVNTMTDIIPLGLTPIVM